MKEAEALGCGWACALYTQCSSRQTAHHYMSRVADRLNPVPVSSALLVREGATMEKMSSVYQEGDPTEAYRGSCGRTTETV